MIGTHHMRAKLEKAGENCLTTSGAVVSATHFEKDVRAILGRGYLFVPKSAHKRQHNPFVHVTTTVTPR